MNYSLNIREVTYALTEALDFVGIDDIMHGKRVAYMAAEVSKEMSWSKETIDEIIFIGMLHDCGVSSTDVHNHLINELDWDNSQFHAIKGKALLEKTSIYSKYSTYVRYHHTHWNELPNELLEDEKNITNLIYLVDRVDAIRAQMKEIGPQATNTIQTTIKKFAGTLFSPELVNAFIKVSSRGSFWFYFEPEALDEYFTEWINIGTNEIYTFSEIKEVGLMFAAVVDAKSTFTSEHSIGVATLSRYLAELFGLREDICQKIELAGLLHDLGKLKVDDAILSKPSKLNADERLKMNRHGFDSNIILRHIKGFKEIARIASLHHETLDSKGYLYQLSASEIPLEARIVAVADIFQALVQNRPYRSGLTMKEAYLILQEMCDEGKLDKDVVSKLKENLESSYKYALVKYEVNQNIV